MHTPIKKITKLSGLFTIVLALLACQSETSAQDTNNKVTSAIKESISDTQQTVDKRTAPNNTTTPTLDTSKYTVLNSPLEVTTGDKIEVVELFWFGCGHCYKLESGIKQWLKEGKPDNAEFIKVPAVFSKRWELHAQTYYTMEALGLLDEATDELFRRVHVTRKPVNSLEDVVSFLSQYGKSEQEITDTFNSFTVDGKLRNAKMITAKSTARGVPAILVDGKYHTSVTLAGGQQQLFDVINQLVEKAASER